jgi:hypothetical protein
MKHVNKVTLYFSIYTFSYINMLVLLYMEITRITMFINMLVLLYKEIQSTWYQCD